MCMMFLPSCTMCVSNALKPAVGARDHRTGVTGGCEPPCGCWKLNPGLLQEPQMLWISEPSVRFPLIQALKQTSLASEQTCFTFAAGSTCSPSYRQTPIKQTTGVRWKTKRDWAAMYSCTHAERRSTLTFLTVSFSNHTKSTGIPVGWKDLPCFTSALRGTSGR